VTALGANDVRLFPVPSPCSPNPNDVVLRNPRAPCATPFVEVVAPDQLPRLQVQQPLFAFVYAPTPRPPPPPPPGPLPSGGGGSVEPRLVLQVCTEDELGNERCLVVLPGPSRRLEADAGPARRLTSTDPPKRRR